MKVFDLRNWTLPLAAAVTLFTAGCAQRAYYVAPGPPPPPPGPSPLIVEAEHNGFRMGVDDGARDAYNRFGYQPKRERAFQETPGYDPRFGPFGPYQGHFRGAYLRGYQKGFYHQ